MDRNVQMDLDEYNEDMVEYFLKFLKVAPLMGLRMVCRAWNRIICRPSFKRIHRQQMELQHEYVTIVCNHAWQRPLIYDNCHYYFRGFSLYHYDDPRHKYVVCCCYGLVCHYDSRHQFVLWNPQTNRRQLIPDQPIRPPNMISLPSGDVHFCMGYDGQNDDIKLVRLTFYQPEECGINEVMVYSRNSRNWERWPNYPYNQPSAEPGVYVGGNIHWIQQHADGEHTSIAVLSMVNRAYSLIVPSGPGYEPIRYVSIGCLDYRTLVLCSCRCRLGQQFTICILRDYQLLNSWYTIRILVDDRITGDDEYEGYVNIQPVQFENNERTRIVLRVDPIGTYEVYDMADNSITRKMDLDEVHGYAYAFKYLQTFDDPSGPFV